MEQESTGTRVPVSNGAAAGAATAGRIAAAYTPAERIGRDLS